VLDRIGEGERMKDPRFANLQARTDHSAEVYAFLDTTFRTRTTAQWLELLEKADVPAGPLHSLKSLLDDEHLKAVGFFERHEHPTEGTVISLRPPSRWSKTPLAIDRLPPAGTAQRRSCERPVHSAERRWLRRAPLRQTPPRTENSMQGKVALITGGTRGIGYAVAQALAREGAQVIVTGRDPAHGAQALDGLRGIGAEAAFEVAEAGDHAAMAGVVGARFGASADSILVSAGGRCARPTPFAE
jgi:3-oxoacyl-ACP reductase-like protein